MRVKDAVGRFGEQVAVDYLNAAGFTIVERNWRCSSGELDIVALDGTELVFVEVKTRSTDRFGSPMEAVDRAKRTRLRRLAVLWMAAEPSVTRPVWSTIRFDVIAVVRPANGNGLSIAHARAAF